MLYKDILDRILAIKARFGKAIAVKFFVSDGFSQSQTGVGSISLSAGRSGEWPILDIGEINFVKYNDNIWTSPENSEVAAQDEAFFRRMSYIQAQYVKALILEMLAKEFETEIPSDAEIISIARERFPDLRL